MRQRKATFWDQIGQYPPYYVRMLAKNSSTGRLAAALSDAEIAIASGIPLPRIRQIVRLTAWAEVTLGEMMSFTIACNFDPTDFNDRRRVASYEYACTKRKTTPFSYLRKSPQWESEILPLLKIAATQRTRPASVPSPTSSSRESTLASSLAPRSAA